MSTILDSKIPEGPLAEKWTNYKALLLHLLAKWDSRY